MLKTKKRNYIIMRLCYIYKQLLAKQTLDNILRAENCEPVFINEWILYFQFINIIQGVLLKVQIFIFEIVHVI